MTLAKFTEKVWKACKDKGWKPYAVSVHVTLGNRNNYVDFSPEELALNVGKEDRMITAKLQIVEYLLTREEPAP